MTFHLYHLVIVGGLAFMAGFCCGVWMLARDIKNGKIAWTREVGWHER